MAFDLKKIGILPRDRDLDYPVDEVRALFADHQIDVCFIEGEEDPEGLDLVVALGGDGTVLKAFARFPHCPVLAINFGTVGFLTAGIAKIWLGSSSFWSVVAIFLASAWCFTVAIPVGRPWLSTK